ncbi:polysaccharide lyase [Vibrio maritimus]|uniref:polysaccharide lyase n=1 Tax=Vibrio maritimus TaxID=990268 RepID=UPI003734E80E
MNSLPSPIVALTFLLLLPSTLASADVIYTNSFEEMEIGPANRNQVKEAWDTRYAKGPDEGRISISTDGYIGNGGRVLNPAFAHSTNYSGVHWETDIKAEEDDLYMSYWIRLDQDFQCVKGGKLPGLAGSESFPRGTKSWSARLMWREDCKLEWYLHGFAVDNPQGSEPYRVLWDDFGAHATLNPGDWHHIELRVKLNTPGKLDGRLQGWLDGIVVSDDWENSGIRATGDSDVKINHLFFSTFFGGSSAPVSQWQPKNDVYSTFDEFIISTKPIGLSTTAQ